MLKPEAACVGQPLISQRSWDAVAAAIGDGTMTLKQSLLAMRLDPSEAQDAVEGGSIPSVGFSSFDSARELDAALDVVARWVQSTATSSSNTHWFTTICVQLTEWHMPLFEWSMSKALRYPLDWIRRRDGEQPGFTRAERDVVKALSTWEMPASAREWRSVDVSRPLWSHMDGPFASWVSPFAVMGDLADVWEEHRGIHLNRVAAFASELVDFWSAEVPGYKHELLLETLADAVRSFPR